MFEFAKRFFGIAILLSLTQILQVSSDCIWYGECGQSDRVSSAKYNCKYLGPPIAQTNQTYLDLLKDLCPHLYNGPNTTSTCCDSAQLNRFNNDLSFPRQLMSRCPACFLNFRTFLCDMTCSPKQNEFLLITAEQPYNNKAVDENEAQNILKQKDEEDYVYDEEQSSKAKRDLEKKSLKDQKMEITEISYYLTSNFTTNMYNSCKDVQYAASNQKIMDIMCGSQPKGCNPQAFVVFIGTNDQSPFVINMNITDNEFDYNSTIHIKPMNTTTYKCNLAIKSANYEAAACGCSDCVDACPKPVPPPDVKVCKLWGTECINIVMIILFAIFTASFVISLFVFNKHEQDSEIEAKLINEEDEKKNENAIEGEKLSLLRVPQVSFFQRLGARTEKILNQIFFKVGFLCASYPISTILVSVLLCSVATAGFSFFSVMTDPVELWSPETSVTRLNKNYYDSHFRPFYRTTQLIVRAKNETPWIHSIFDDSGAVQYSSIFQYDFLSQVLQLQNQISSLTGVVYCNANGTSCSVDKKDDLNVAKIVKLKDVCFAPLLPENDNCTVQSILNYWQNSEENLQANVSEFDLVTADYITHFKTCVSTPTNTNDTLGLSCLGDFGGTVMPFVGLGAYPNDALGKPQYGNATALVITFIINNHKDDSLNVEAMAWEKRVIEFLKNEYKNENMSISFSTERSIQDELNRESQSDIKTILISYMAMFLYITLTLGSYNVFSNSGRGNIFRRCFSVIDLLLVDMKVMLGIAGVIIVMLSVTSSIGLFSYFHIRATLIIFEVIPFLVLAVGVDNIFILVQNYQRDVRLEGESLENQIGRIVGKVGPSMLLTSSAESLAFVLGALTPMPAVKIFSLYAALAVFIDFVLQITCFVSLMTLDCKRELSKRYNLFCCIQSFTQRDQDEPRTSQIVADSTLRSSALNQDDDEESKKGGLLFTLFKNYYSNFVLNSKVRPLVIIVFLAIFFTSSSLVPKVNIGLDQKLSMPKDSYVLDYFEALEKYLSVGVPVYFVVKNGLNYSDINNQNLICSSSGCDPESLLNQINQAALLPNYTKIAIPANSWLDDYFDWLSSGDCCFVYSNDTNKFCPAIRAEQDNCVPCPAKFTSGTNRPIVSDFYKYFKFYIKDNPGLKCAKGGHAAYGEAVEILDNPNAPASYDIGASFFMGYHTVGVKSNDFIESLKHADEIATNVTKTMRETAKKFTNDTEYINKLEVFPYSVSYVFYEQYLTIWKDSVVNLSISLTAIFFVTAFLMGLDFYTSTIVCLTISMIVVNMFGAMYLLGIELNAVSLVNIVMAIGISVEFCAHIAREFAICVKGSRISRAKYAISHMGSSVFSGITLTKILGIIVLAFSHSQLFQVFYFRMYLSVVIIGASHGLIFLPILLSYVGPSLNKLKYFEQVSLSSENKRFYS